MDLDPTILNKVPTLEGKAAAEFRSYSFVLRAALGMVSEQFPSDLETCVNTQEPIDLVRVGSTDHRQRCGQL